MIKKKISQLPVSDSLTGSELIETVQGGVNKKTTALAIAGLGSGANTGYKRVDENNYVALSSEYVLSVDNGVNEWLIFLPSPVGLTGKTMIVKRHDDTSTGILTVASVANACQRKNGTYGVVTIAAWGTFDDKVMFMSNGTNWEFIK